MNVLSPPIWVILCRACERQGRSRCLMGQLLRRDSMGAMTAVFVHGVPETPAVWRGLLAALDRPDSVVLSLPGLCCTVRFAP